MLLNRRELLRLGGVGASSLLIGSAASAQSLSSSLFIGPSNNFDPLAPAKPKMTAPDGINPDLFERAMAALDSHAADIPYRDTVGIVDFTQPSHLPRFYVVNLVDGTVESHLVAHGRGSDPRHCGYLERFSNRIGSEASSSGTYITAETYQGKYGLSMRVRGLDDTNSNAETRAIVIHNAWYAEPEMVAEHGKLGRSEGCFAFSRASQWRVMNRLYGGRMIYADKIA